MPSLIVMAAWRNLGYLVVIFLAGLQVVPKEMHEAASIDGAGTWARFRNITLPLMRPTCSSVASSPRSATCSSSRSRS
jgi:multiple sugar transport system permease protein